MKIDYRRPLEDYKLKQNYAHQNQPTKYVHVMCGSFRLYCVTCLCDME